MATFTTTRGLPASGKSTWARHQAGVEYECSTTGPTWLRMWRALGLTVFQVDEDTY